jgi:hypothetical protein
VTTRNQHTPAALTEEQLQEAERRNQAGESWQAIADSFTDRGFAVSKPGLYLLVKGERGPRRRAKLAAQGEAPEEGERPEPPEHPEPPDDPDFPAWLYPDPPKGLVPVWATPETRVKKWGTEMATFTLARFTCPRCNQEPEALGGLQLRVPADYRGCAVLVPCCVDLAVLLPAGAHVRGETMVGERSQLQPAEGPPLPFSWDLLTDPDGTTAWVTPVPEKHQATAPVAHAQATEWTPSRGAVVYRCPFCRNSSRARRMTLVPKLHAGLRGAGSCRVPDHAARFWLQLPTVEEGLQQAEEFAQGEAQREAEEAAERARRGPYISPQEELRQRIEREKRDRWRIDAQLLGANADHYLQAYERCFQQAAFRGGLEFEAMVREVAEGLRRERDPGVHEQRAREAEARAELARQANHQRELDEVLAAQRNRVAS